MTGVKTELNIFITDKSNGVARDRAIFISGTKHFHQENTQLKGRHSNLSGFFEQMDK